MTKTLKRRFIIFTMTAVTGLLVFLVLAINGLNWMMLEHQSDSVLEMLVASDGVFHRMDFERPPRSVPPMNLERMRSSRFLIVKGDADGNIIEVNADQIPAVDDQTAQEYAQTVWASGKQSGQLDGYKFAVKQSGGTRLAFFVDVSELRGNFYRVLFASGLIAVLCWLILLVIVVCLSGRVIRPVLAGMEKQKQFITNAGHEMKTPLAIIQSNNDTMALIHGENKYNAHIRAQTKRLNVLMSNLLTLAKLDEEIPLPTQTVQVSETVEELLPPYQDAALTRRISFQAQVEPEIVKQINQESFRQMMTLLLDNAVKYTPEEGTITLTVKTHGRHLQIVEENTCLPSHEADPERLFERFYRGDSARTQDKSSCGYGIGLSAARAICEKFGGKLTAEYPCADRIRFTAIL